MLYIGHLIILDGQSIKKSVSEIPIFELLFCRLPPTGLEPWTFHLQRHCFTN